MAMSQEEKQARRLARNQAREAAKVRARIEAERNQKPVKSLIIVIEWHPSRAYGFVPHAEAQVEYHDGTMGRKRGYTASGCGYDKESTVIAAIFNDFLKYKLWGPLPADKHYWYNGEQVDRPYGIYMRDDYRCYDGGIGVSCYREIAVFIGGRFEYVAGGSISAVYRYTDGAGCAPERGAI